MHLDVGTCWSLVREGVYRGDHSCGIHQEPGPAYDPGGLEAVAEDAVEEALLCFHVCNAFLGVQAVQEPGEDVSVCKNPNLRGSMSEKSTRSLSRSLQTEAAPTLPTSAFSADAQSGGRAPHLSQGATLNLSLLNQGQGWTQHSQRGRSFTLLAGTSFVGRHAKGRI